jgi:transcriptional regulator with XRE-family HTH domain
MELRVKSGELLSVALKQARTRANLSQVELGLRLGVSYRAIQYWEAGQVPQPRHRRAIQEFLDEFESDGVAA